MIKKKKALVLAGKARTELLLRYNTPLNDHGHSLALMEALLCNRKENGWDHDNLDYVEFLIQNKAKCDLALLSDTFFLRNKFVESDDDMYRELCLPNPFLINERKKQQMSE